MANKIRVKLILELRGAHMSRNRTFYYGKKREYTELGGEI